jgi:hypothetical protein
MVGADGRPARGLYWDDPAKETDACSMCIRMSGSIQPLASWYRTCKRVVTPNSQGKLDSCEQCFFLRRPCVWLPIADLMPIGGRFSHVRVPHRQELQVQTIEGLQILARQLKN